jgi:hypothetical protein
MLNQPTIEKLHTMKLYGMADAFRAQIEMADTSHSALRSASECSSTNSGCGRKTVP